MNKPGSIENRDFARNGSVAESRFVQIDWDSPAHPKLDEAQNVRRKSRTLYQIVGRL